ncbi:heme-degrading domain-containing protein [Caballeronia sp. BR00000012568055]|uniref:heme-degrading domain-containing protein n=1 Tax=Caballeronia sp. BR00000012568055 TaxID=2918761 RepID=UPI0023F90C14|nr:heme-degrading domain-containing protein [Caballeronia sp. BR00000012568055]
MDIPHDLQIIAHQERSLVFPQFHADEAWQLGTQLREMAVARDAALVIDIRTFGRQLFHVALDGTTPSNTRWAERKARTVEHFHRSSYAIGLSLQQANATFTEKYAMSLEQYAVHGGSFPLRVANAGVIGAVTVSGLPQRDDHQFVVEALCAVLGQDFSALSLGRA